MMDHHHDVHEAILTHFIQAAVNISIVGGKLSAERAQAMSSRGRGIDSQGGQNYSAAAMSLVYHPSHPFIPTLRADIRRFKVYFTGVVLLRVEEIFTFIYNVQIDIEKL